MSAASPFDYGLVPADQAGPIMDRLLAKMKEVGFNRFDLGLPGNLVAVPLEGLPLAEKGPRFGGGDEGGRLGGFPALRERRGDRLLRPFHDRRPLRHGPAQQADEILLPLLGAFDRNDFEGRDFLDRAKDWKSWDGAAFGYEGYLADNYYALLSVLAREGLLRSGRECRESRRAG